MICKMSTLIFLYIWAGVLHFLMTRFSVRDDKTQDSSSSLSDSIQCQRSNTSGSYHLLPEFTVGKKINLDIYIYFPHFPRETGNDNAGNFSREIECGKSGNCGNFFIDNFGHILGKLSKIYKIYLRFGNFSKQI